MYMASQSETLVNPSVICPPRTVCLPQPEPTPIMIDDSDSEHSTEEHEAENNRINGRGRKRQREDEVTDRRKRLRTSMASEASNATDEDVIDLTSERDVIDVENMPLNRPVAPSSSRNAPLPSGPYSLRSFSVGQYPSPLPRHISYQPYASAAALDFLFNSLPSVTLRSLSGYGEHTHARQPDDLEDRFGGGYWSRRHQQRHQRPSNSTQQGHVTILDDDDHPSSDSSTSTSTSMSGSSEGTAEKAKVDNKSSAMSALTKDLKCPVCLCACENITATVCGHIFCEGCILRSIEEQRKCPVCRCSLTKKSIHPLFF